MEDTVKGKFLIYYCLTRCRAEEQQCGGRGLDGGFGVSTVGHLRPHRLSNITRDSCLFQWGMEGIRKPVDLARSGSSGGLCK